MQMEEQAKILKARRAEIAGELSEIEQALDAPMPKDWEDRASERQGDEVLESLGHVEMAELKRIDAALARIDAGTYGICLKCDEPISDARLAVVPDAALCKSCA